MIMSRGSFISQSKIALKVKIADLEDNMDIRRLDVLTEKDMERLNRYLKAWRYVTGSK
jgi:translation elongation factor EF-Ts